MKLVWQMYSMTAFWLNFSDLGPGLACYRPRLAAPDRWFCSHQMMAFHIKLVWQMYSMTAFWHNFSDLGPGLAWYRPRGGMPDYRILRLPDRAYKFHLVNLLYSITTNFGHWLPLYQGAGFPEAHLQISNFHKFDTVEDFLSGALQNGLV